VGQERGKTEEARGKKGEARRTKWDLRLAGRRPLVTN
jgi:hypothetical protein